jgi:hypothetical protein
VQLNISSRVPLPGGAFQAGEREIWMTISSFSKLIGRTICCLLVAGWVSGVGATDSRRVAELLDQSREGGRFEMPSDTELARSRQLFYRLFKSDLQPDLFEQWKTLGFAYQQIELSGKPYICLYEKDADRRGRGFYLFAKAPTARHVLMMPHGFYDLHTREIGFDLSREGHFAAIVWNTVHRYGADKGISRNRGYRHRPDSSDPTDTWDMARLSRSYFTAFTHAFAGAEPRGCLIQLHGFSQKKRDSRAGRDADMIISNGTRQLSHELRAFSDCLKIGMPGMIRSYPTEVEELGGTQNTIGALLRARGHTGFVHIEMSYPLRVRLKKESALRQVFLQCIDKHL